MLQDSLKEVETKYTSLFKKFGDMKAKELLNKFDENHVICEYLSGFNKEGIMNVYDDLKTKYTDYRIVLIGDENGKHPIIYGLGKDLVVKGLKSKDELKKVTDILGGSGGGRPDMSQGNVDSVDKVDLVYKNIIK